MAKKHPTAKFTAEQAEPLIEPVCLLADLTIGRDHQLNELIEAARIIKAREGFAVVTYEL